MRSRSMAHRAAVLAACLTVAACADLTVTNNNNPDRLRATNTPGDVQALIAGTFQRWWPNVYSTTPTVMFGAMGYEFSTPFLCFAGQPMEKEPRPAWNNSSAFTNANVSSTTWLNFYGVISLANDGLQALDRGVARQRGDVVVMAIEQVLAACRRRIDRNRERPRQRCVRVEVDQQHALVV